MRTVVITYTLAALGCLVVGCGGDQSTVKDPYLKPESRQKEAPVGAAPSCVDDADKPVQCEYDNECCEGFVCGIDPEVNSRVKHCIYSGK
jgi:hypothetical protein